MSGGRKLGPRQLAALCEIGVDLRYRPGELLFREGDRSEHVIVLRHGAVKVYATARSGYETVLAIRSAGEIVGEFAAFDQRQRSASVVALGDVRGLLIAGQAFRGYLSRDPRLALALLSGLVERLRESDRRRMEFGAYDVTARVARLLLEVAQPDTATTGTVATSAATAGAAATSATTVALSQREVAGIVGASREAVARSLRLLRDRGAIATNRRCITVLAPATLRTIGDEPSPLRTIGDEPPPVDHGAGVGSGAGTDASAGVDSAAS